MCLGVNFESYDKVEGLVREALQVGEIEKGQTDIFSDLETVLDEDYRHPIPMGIPGIDNLLKGGLAKGEIGVILAPTGATPVDLATDKDVKELSPEGEDEEGEKLDITDLVDSQKNIEQKQEEYFNNLFNQLSTLEKKLADMDQLVSKIDGLESKIEKMRPKTPEEKLELRSLDSGPFNQKLTDFFDDKQDEMEKSGKNEYVLTSDDVESFSKDQIEDSFYDYEDNEKDTDVM